MSVHVRLESVRKSFPNGSERLQVLREVSLELAPGEQVALTGESGSGKSTILSLIAGLDTPDDGSIRVGETAVEALDGRDLDRYRSHTVGLVFQFHYLLRDFTALENVMLPAMVSGRSRNELRREARELLDAVGLSERTDHLPAQLSGGERQRVALARALINHPALILADEPTGNLDDTHSRHVEEILFELVSRQNRTLILVTHNTDLARRTGRVMRLESGCLSPA
ncbi:MAG: ABC transporter ATP-binding protein [Alkalispirochaeta sp.]